MCPRSRGCLLRVRASPVAGQPRGPASLLGVPCAPVLTCGISPRVQAKSRRPRRAHRSTARRRPRLARTASRDSGRVLRRRSRSGWRSLGTSSCSSSPCLATAASNPVVRRRCGSSLNRCEFSDQPEHSGELGLWRSRLQGTSAAGLSCRSSAH